MHVGAWGKNSDVLNIEAKDIDFINKLVIFNGQEKKGVHKQDSCVG